MIQRNYGYLSAAGLKAPLQNQPPRTAPSLQLSSTLYHIRYNKKIIDHYRHQEAGRRIFAKSSPVKGGTSIEHPRRQKTYVYKKESIKKKQLYQGVFNQIKFKSHAALEILNKQ